MANIKMDIYEEAEKILGSPTAVRAWFLQPNPRFGGKTPQQALQQECGHDIVLHVLKYGNTLH